jgi:hypothetical protein
MFGRFEYDARPWHEDGGGQVLFGTLFGGEQCTVVSSRQLVDDGRLLQEYDIDELLEQMDDLAMEGRSVMRGVLAFGSGGFYHRFPDNCLRAGMTIHVRH